MNRIQLTSTAFNKFLVLLYDKRNADMHFVVCIICCKSVFVVGQYLGDGAADRLESLQRTTNIKY